MEKWTVRIGNLLKKDKESSGSITIHVKFKKGVFNKRVTTFPIGVYRTHGEQTGVTMDSSI